MKLLEVEDSFLRPLFSLSATVPATGIEAHDRQEAYGCLLALLGSLASEEPSFPNFPPCVSLATKRPSFLSFVDKPTTLAEDYMDAGLFEHHKYLT